MKADARAGHDGSDHLARRPKERLERKRMALRDATVGWHFDLSNVTFDE